MRNLKQSLFDDCYGKDLEQRKHWYSPAAEAYHQVRPRYPQALIAQVVEIAQLSSRSTLLEVGCGPANATPVRGVPAARGGLSNASAISKPLL